MLDKIFIITLLIFTGVLFASESDMPEGVDSVGEISEPLDIETEATPVEEDSTPHPENFFESLEPEVKEGFYLPKSPAKAAFLSAFIPGAGQIYNEKYIKAGVVIGLQAYLIGMTVHYDRQMRDYKKKARDIGSPDYYHNRFYYVQHYESRQSFIFWIGASVLFSALDAYVDAHLINFQDTKKDIHLKFADEKLVLSIEF